MIQIRRGIELDNIYHVSSAHNPADIGTRPELVAVEDVQQKSSWISGVQWMREDIDEAVKKGILKPVADLRLSTSEQVDDFYDGCIFNQVPEVLTRGHVLNQRRIQVLVFHALP